MISVNGDKLPKVCFVYGYLVHGVRGCKVVSQVLFFPTDQTQ